MPYIESGEERIDPGTPEDIERLFEASRIFGVAVYQDATHCVKATVTGDSALVVFLDQKKAKTQKPQGRVDRDGAIAILKTYLDEGTLHPDYTWINVDLPRTSTRKGCGAAAVAVMLFVGLVVALAASFTTWAGRGESIWR